MKIEYTEPDTRPIKRIVIDQPNQLGRYEAKKTIIVRPRKFGPNITKDHGITLSGQGDDRQYNFEIGLDIERATELRDAIDALLKYLKA